MTDEELKKAAEEYAFYNFASPDYNAQVDWIGYCEKVFLAGAEWQKERDNYDTIFWKGIQYAKKQMMEEAVKWLVDDDYHELSEKGRFILGSVGIGYNGYYIPYSDLLKLPKED